MRRCITFFELFLSLSQPKQGARSPRSPYSKVPPLQGDSKRRFGTRSSPVRVPTVRRPEVDGDDDKVAVLRRLFLLLAEMGNQLGRFPATVFVVAARARRHEGGDLLGGGLDVVAGDGGGHGRHRLVGQDRPKGIILSNSMLFCQGI